MSSNGSIRAGAFVVSLDFELLWGGRDRWPADGGSYRRNLLGAREAVPSILEVFREFQVAATWATVGILFARNRSEAIDYMPCVRPSYSNPRLDPYKDGLGDDECSAPLQFGRSLLERILETPRQEIGSQTFSHYYCLEPGHTPEAFRADLESARSIARDSMGVTLQSLVFPRNQVNLSLLRIIEDAGFMCYRGNQEGGCFAASKSVGNESRLARAERLVDSYLPAYPDSTFRWSDVASASSGLCNVPASRFLRPFNSRLRGLETLKLARIKKAMATAAHRGMIYHLWWHPHNFGADVNASISQLSEILSEFRSLRDKFGFSSMSMIEATNAANAVRLVA